MHVSNEYCLFNCINIYAECSEKQLLPLILSILNPFFFIALIQEVFEENKQLFYLS